MFAKITNIYPVVPEFPIGITSIVTTLAIAAIIIAAKRMSFLQMGKMY
jgi:hypothetical protein